MPETVPGRNRRRRAALLAALAVTLVARAHAETTVPAARGRELYDKMCAVCHGPNGEGYRADQAPRIAHPDFLSAVNDDYLRHAVAQGRPGTTMSAWGKDRGGPLSPADIDAIVALMRTWDHAPRVKLDEHLLSGNPSRG